LRNSEAIEVKISSTNFQRNGVTTPGPSIMTGFRLTRHSLCSNFLFLRIWQSSLRVPPKRTSPLWSFPVPEDEI
jgi:hypothetical protein